MKMPRRFIGGEADIIMQCQALCARQVGCAHFTMEVSSRTCHLATVSAAPLPGVLNSISGPAVCGPRGQQDIFMQRKYAASGLPSTFLGSRTSTLAWLSSAVAVAG